MPALPKAPKHTRPALSLSKSDLEVLLHESELAAVRLARRVRVPTFEKDDFRQDLLVDLLGRTRSFDPTRGKLGAFAGTVIRHRASRIELRIRREKRLFVDGSKSPASNCADGTHLNDYERGAEQDHPYFQQSHEASIIETRLDLERALAGLSSTYIRLCSELIDYTPSEISKKAGRSRAGIYRAITKIRTHMVRGGITIAS